MIASNTSPPGVLEGWTRYFVKNKFGPGRDFAVLDTDEKQMFFDGRWGLRAKANLRDAAGKVSLTALGTWFGITSRIMDPQSRF
jgi:hypothetical protein